MEQQPLSLEERHTETARLLDVLKPGVDFWNDHRKTNPSLKFDLFMAELEGRALHDINFADAKLEQAKLHGADLRNANLQNAVLCQSDLSEAILFEAILSGADMQRVILKGADLGGAHLDGVKLSGANLQGATLYGANGLAKEQLQQASNWILASYSVDMLAVLGLPPGHNDRIPKKDFSSFDFQNADLRAADFQNANLAQADLLDANLQGADFRRARNLTPEQLRKARNWPLAFYDPELGQSLGLSAEHNRQISDSNLTGARLDKANLRGADLRGFKLQDASLQSANLQDALLEGVNLQGVDLCGATGLTVEQLRVAPNWLLAHYSQDLITSLGLSKDHNVRSEKRNLSGVDLTGALLPNALLAHFNFQGAVLANANLSCADLSNADLSGANLQAANLQGANLQGAQLHNANLMGAKLQTARGLTQVQLHQAKNWLRASYSPEVKAVLGTGHFTDDIIAAQQFTNINLENALLYDADLDGAEFSNAKLNGANLRASRFKKATLKKAELCKADLRDADLAGATLEDADLTDADLRGANLTGANLKGATLKQTLLRDTNLENACLDDVKGLLGGQLGGANVSGAALPVDIKEFKGLASIDESSKNASSLFIAILAACLYSLLTIASTKDAALLTNSASSPLPIIQTPIPIVGFYVVAPLLLFAIYIYFHLSLQRLWEQLADQPAIFPDGKPLDKRAYPWLLNGLVQSNFKQLSGSRPALSHLQAVISFLLAWWLVPATLLFFWLRYLPRQDWTWTLLHILLLATAVASAAALPRLAGRTLKGETIKKFSLRQPLRDGRELTYVLLPLIIAAVFFVISYKIFVGASYVLCVDSQNSLGRTDADISLNWAQRAFALIRYPFAELVEADVSTKPESWTGKNKDELALVKGATLKGMNLKYAEAVRAFMVNADLREANLQGADLAEADMRGANLSSATLINSCLIKADLSGANLRNANLKNANLKQTNLFGANVEGAFLGGANIQAARNWIFASYDKATLARLKLKDDHNERLYTKNLSGYNLMDVVFYEDDLSDFNLSGAYLKFAILDHANLKGANLRQAILNNAYLQGAHLEGANLAGAHLDDAHLAGAHFEGADLTDVVGLTPEQIKTMIVDEKTRLPRPVETVAPKKGKR